MPRNNFYGKIMLGHGSGGRLMHDLIKGLFLKKLNNPILKELSDSAVINYKEKIAFSTDSFVVSPLKFPGGDIGRLAVCGTLNDLVMQGAVPGYLSLAVIIEEGLDYKILEDIVGSIARNLKQAKVKCVTGDLKVVEKGACDKLFINTSGLGRVLPGARLSLKNIEPGDRIIITGKIAEHGLAVLAGRRGLDFDFKIKSDCAALGGLLLPLLKKNNPIKFMRDPTRGGIAATLNEIAQAAKLGIIIKESSLPLSGKARAACELLGLDPLYVANEGKAVMIVKKEESRRIVACLEKHPLGKNAVEIGEVVAGYKGEVILKTFLGTRRIVDMPISELLPRIC